MFCTCFSSSLEVVGTAGGRLRRTICSHRGHPLPSLSSSLFFLCRLPFGFAARSTPEVTTPPGSGGKDPDLFPQFTIGRVYERAEYQAKIEELSDRVNQAEVEVSYLLCREAELKRQVEELEKKVRKATAVLRKSR